MSFPQFALWRLLGSVTCFSVLAIGIIRFAKEARDLGGEYCLAACFIFAISLVIAGFGLLFRKNSRVLDEFLGRGYPVLMVVVSSRLCLQFRNLRSICRESDFTTREAFASQGHAVILVAGLE